MPRNISFALTTDQIRNQQKTVTRRKGWKFLKDGEILNACVKCMGLKPGETIERLGQIRVVNVRREPLNAIAETWEMHGNPECSKEGFPGMTGQEFVDMFRTHMGGDENQEVTRIEFEYMQAAPTEAISALPPQCNCTDRIAPCDGVLAGGMCDDIQDDPEDENGCFFCSRRDCRGECEGL